MSLSEKIAQLVSNGEVFTAEELSTLADTSKRNLQHILKKMIKEGALHKIARGQYSTNPQQTPKQSRTVAMIRSELKALELNKSILILTQGEKLTISQLIEKTGSSPQGVRKALQRLSDQGVDLSELIIQEEKEGLCEKLIEVLKEGPKSFTDIRSLINSGNGTSWVIKKLLANGKIVRQSRGVYSLTESNLVGSIQ